LGLVHEWAELHRDELTGNWERARSKDPLEEINPLPYVEVDEAVLRCSGAR
jgi:hypothetical protein